LSSFSSTSSSSSSPSFPQYRTTVLADAAASNVVYANGTLLRRCDHEFPTSADGLRALAAAEGVAKVVQVEAGELAKVDGALTCCSLLLMV
jgi:hypothetical protein